LFPQPKCLQLPVSLSVCAPSVHQAGSALSGDPCQHSGTQVVPSYVTKDAQA